MTISQDVAQSDVDQRRRRRLWPVYLLLFVSVPALSIWLLFFANRPARQVGQLVISPVGRSPVTLTLWSADPMVDLPFTGDTSWVRCGANQWKLHGREFGNSVGGVAVAPDRTQAVAYRWFEGHDYPAVHIDLRTGAMQAVHPWSDYKSQGWTMHDWQ